MNSIAKEIKTMLKKSTNVAACHAKDKTSCDSHARIERHLDVSFASSIPVDYTALAANIARLDKK
ncbi:hypothetical protein [Arsukibacterium sp.]|uniref:hypothetical protein n=1 Tax=Arsukibacterium sp. TaxID=1977258 RepID=UPI00356A535F